MDPRNPDSIVDGAIEDWIAHGLRCVVRPGPYCLNGYVRLPDSFVGKTQILCGVRAATFGAFDEDVTVSLGPWKESGVEYNPRWVGFFTGHYGMYWNPADLEGFVNEEGMSIARNIHRISAPHDQDGSLLWTRKRLHDAVEKLAAAISAMRGEENADA